MTFASCTRSIIIPLEQGLRPLKTGATNDLPACSIIIPLEQGLRQILNFLRTILQQVLLSFH